MLPIIDELIDIKMQLTRINPNLLEYFLKNGPQYQINGFGRIMVDERRCQEFLVIYKYFSLLEEASRAMHLVDPTTLDGYDRLILKSLRNPANNHNLVSYFQYGFAYCLKRFEQTAVQEFNKLFNANSQYDSFAKKWQAKSELMPVFAKESEINNYLDYIDAQKIGSEEVYIKNNRIKIIENIFSDEMFLNNLQGFGLEATLEKEFLLKNFKNFDEYFADLQYRYLTAANDDGVFVIEGVKVADEEKFSKFLNGYRSKLNLLCEKFLEESGLDLISEKLPPRQTQQHSTNSQQSLRRESVVNSRPQPALQMPHERAVQGMVERVER